jgi:alkylhydroperoxidase family enzyme
MRITGLERNQASWFLRPLYTYLKRRFGKELTPYKVWAHRPGTVLALGALMATIDGSRVVDRKLKSLASIRTAQIIGCPF